MLRFHTFQFFDFHSCPRQFIILNLLMFWICPKENRKIPSRCTPAVISNLLSTVLRKTREDEVLLLSDTETKFSAREWAKNDFFCVCLNFLVSGSRNFFFSLRRWHVERMDCCAVLGRLLYNHHILLFHSISKCLITSRAFFFRHANEGRDDSEKQQNVARKWNRTIKEIGKEEEDEKNLVWGFLSFYPIDFTLITMKLKAQLEQFLRIFSLDLLLVLLSSSSRWSSSTFHDTFPLVENFYSITANANRAEDEIIIII